MSYHLRLSRLFSVFIVILTVIGTGIMLTSHEEGILTVYGIHNLKFFTVESNLLIGIAHIIFLFRSKNSPLWLERLIYISTVAVSLTFAVVMLFFGPSLGYFEMIQGANLYFHLIEPLLGIMCFVLFHRRSIPLWETFFALLPTIIYGLYYVIVLLLFGTHFPETDWYGFASGGVVGSVCTAAVILLLTWVLALLLRLGANTRR